MPEKPEKLNHPGWPKGVSGNPGGRPKEKLLTDAIRVRLHLSVKDFLTADEMNRSRLPAEMREGTVADLIADRFVRAALANESAGTRQFRELLDRIEGRVPLPIIGADDGPLQLEIVSNIKRPDRRKKK